MRFNTCSTVFVRHRRHGARIGKQGKKRELIFVAQVNTPEDDVIKL
jgi:hypothetical protein